MLSTPLHLAAASLLSVSPVDLDFEFRKVVCRGDAAPGAAAGLVFEHFGHLPNLGGSDGAPPAIDELGNVAFHAFLGDGDTGTMELGERGVWHEIDGTLQLVAAFGDPAPGTGTTFTGFVEVFGHTPSVYAGTVTLVGSVNPGGGQLHGAWSNRFGSLELVLLDTDPLPGTPPSGQVSFFSFAQRANHFFANARWVAPGNFGPENEGLWVDGTGSFELIAINGLAAPGTPPGVIFDEGTGIAFFGPVDRWDGNAVGQAVFNGYLGGPGVDVLSDEGVWFGAPGALDLIAREGDQVPGEPAGTLWGAGTGFRAFGDPALIPATLNDGGAILFGADMRGVGFDHANTVWTTRSGALERVALGFSALPGNPPGDPAPGLPGRTFSAFFTGRINVSGEIALSGGAKLGPLDELSGIWWDRPGALTLLAAQGEPVPTLSGVVYSRLGSPVLDDGSRLFYLAELAGAGVGLHNDFALFLVQPDGTQNVILRTGDALDLAGDGSDVRTVAVMVVGSGVTAEGGLVLELFFTDGTVGIVTVRPVSEPPPGASTFVPKRV